MVDTRINGLTTIAEIAEALKKDRSTVSRWATDQCWKSNKVFGKGKPLNTFQLKHLPPAIAQAVIALRHAKFEQTYLTHREADYGQGADAETGNASVEPRALQGGVCGLLREDRGGGGGVPVDPDTVHQGFPQPISGGYAGETAANKAGLQGEASDHKGVETAADDEDGQVKQRPAGADGQRDNHPARLAGQGDRGNAKGRHEAARGALPAPPHPVGATTGLLGGGDKDKNPGHNLVIQGAESRSTVDNNQQLIGDCRLVILRYCSQYKAAHGVSGGKLENALAQLNQAYQGGTLESSLMKAVTTAGRGAGLSASTVQKWLAQHKAEGHCIPKKTKVKASWQSVWWVPLFFKHYQQPQKPPMTTVYKAFEADLQNSRGTTPPSYTTVVRVLKEIPRHTREKGRINGAELKAMLPYVIRDWSVLKSNDVWVGDGYTFKAKVKHPETGRAFAPEVTVIMDCRSRLIVGWAFGYAENQLAVSAAICSGMKKYGVPLNYYSDNGSGQTAKTLDDGCSGLFARFGVNHETGIPGNPQGRGIIERLWQHTTLHVGKTATAYQGKDMDKEQLRKVTAEINKAHRKGTTPDFVWDWQEFIARVEQRFEWYNQHHQHASLKKQTPIQVFQDNRDLEHERLLTADEAIGLYRLGVTRKTSRGMVKLANNEYFSQTLMELPEEIKVTVNYDLMDADKVWVHHLDGRFICEAVWNDNKRDAFPKAMFDVQREVRRDGKVKGGQAKIDEAYAEFYGVIETEQSKPVFETPYVEPEPPIEKVTYVPPVKDEEPPQEKMNAMDSFVYANKLAEDRIKKEKEAEALVDGDDPKNEPASL